MRFPILTGLVLLVVPTAAVSPTDQYQDAVCFPRLG